MRKVFLIFVLVLSTLAHAHDNITVDEMVKTSGWVNESTEIKVQELGKGLYVLFGGGGNIAASIGERGVLLVDDQFQQLIPKIKSTIADLGGRRIDFAINTHWHFDHADGNQALGPEGTWLVAQNNSRAMMAESKIINTGSMRIEQPAYPEIAKPVITFQDRMRFYFNGERVDLLHFGPAHTAGDAAIVFRGHNAVHLGDVFNNSGYPFIDSGNGGDLDGMIRFCKQVLAEIDEDTTVIPGHGPVTDYQGLVDYIDMLETVRKRLVTLIGSGASLASVVAAKPTTDFDQTFGDPASFVDRAYTSLVLAGY